MIRKTLAALAGGFIIVATMVTGAAAAPAPEPDGIDPNSVETGEIVNGTILQQDVNADVVGVFRTPMADSVSSWNLRDNGVYEQDLHSSVRDKLNAPDDDSAGSVGVSAEWSPVTITDIGGTFGKFTATVRATKIAEFELPAGSWNLQSSAFFMRTVAGVEGTRPQLALRVDDGSDWGLNFGTTMGTEISESANREVTGSTFEHVQVDEPTTVQVFAFGYNDDGSAAGSGEITASAKVLATRVG